LLYKINGYQKTNLFNFLSQFVHLTATFKVLTMVVTTSGEV